GCEDDLRVGCRPKAATARLELCSKLAVVVDLPVVNELQRAVVARQRLCARSTEVEDREAPAAEPDALGLEQALPVRAAMGKRVAHPADRLDVRRAPQLDHAADPAHRPAPQACARASLWASALKRRRAAAL